MKKRWRPRSDDRSSSATRVQLALQQSQHPLLECIYSGKWEAGFSRLSDEIIISPVACVHSVSSLCTLLPYNTKK